MKKRKKPTICSYLVKKTVSKNSGTGKFVTYSTSSALKAVVAGKKKSAKKWDSKARARLAEVRTATNKRYSSVFKTLAQY